MVALAVDLAAASVRMECPMHGRQIGVEPCGKVVWLYRFVHPCLSKAAVESFEVMVMHQVNRLAYQAADTRSDPCLVAPFRRASCRAIFAPMHTRGASKVRCTSPERSCPRVGNCAKPTTVSGPKPGRPQALIVVQIPKAHLVLVTRSSASTSVGT